jgi:competence protein ComEA
MDELTEKLRNFISHYRFPLIIGIAGLIFFIYGLISLFHKSPSNDINFTSADKQSSSESAASPPSEKVVVDIAGAVKKPGIYHIAEDSRVGDAISAAGGLSEDADKELIAKQFNLAMKVSDGMKLYIPRAGEEQRAESVGFSAANTSTGVMGAASQMDINTAGIAELDSLKGVGKVTAEKIISGRPYTAIDELLTKKIVSQKVFDQIKNEISTF